MVFGRCTEGKGIRLVSQSFEASRCSQLKAAKKGCLPTAGNVPGASHIGAAALHFTHALSSNQVSAYFPSAPASPAGCQPSLEKKEKRKRNSHSVENVDSRDAGIRPLRGRLLASPPPTFLIQWGFFQGGQRDRRKGQNWGTAMPAPCVDPLSPYGNFVRMREQEPSIVIQHSKLDRAQVSCLTLNSEPFILLSASTEMGQEAIAHGGLVDIWQAGRASSV